MARDGFTPDNKPVPAPFADAPLVGSGSTYEEREIARKLRAHQAEEFAKGIEAGTVGEIVQTLNEKLMTDGIELIDFTEDLLNQPRSPEAQQSAAKFLKHVQNKALNDQIATTNIGIQAEQQILQGSLKPAPKKKGFFERE